MELSPSCFSRLPFSFMSVAFMIRWLTRAPWQTLRILAIQIAAALVALVPVLKKPTMIFELTSRGRQWRFAQGPTVRCQSSMLALGAVGAVPEEQFKQIEWCAVRDPVTDPNSR